MLEIKKCELKEQFSFIEITEITIEFAKEINKMNQGIKIECIAQDIVLNERPFFKANILFREGWHNRQIYLGEFLTIGGGGIVLGKMTRNEFESRYRVIK
jgi:hypothetical protein